MRQSIRALGWTVTISMLLLFAFLATTFYSVYNTIATGEDIQFGEFQTSLSDKGALLSMPISVNNTGYYDMTDFNITTTLKDPNGAVLAANTTRIPEVKIRQTETRLHNLTLDLTQILSEMTYLLFSDTEFKIDLSVSFRCANALGFQLAIANMSTPWGAPLYGLNLTETSPPNFDGTDLSIYLTLEVENHSFLDIAGELSFRVYNDMGKRIGTGTQLLQLPPHSGLTGPIELIFEIENPSDFTGKGHLEAHLNLPVISQSVELGRLDYG